MVYPIKILHIASIGSLSKIPAHKPHQSQKDPFLKERERIRLQKKMTAYLNEQINYYSIIWCHSGLLSDTDYIWVRVVLDMQLKYPSKIKLHVHIPHEGYIKEGVPRGMQTMLWVEYIDAAHRVTTYTTNTNMTVRTVKNDISASKTTTGSEKILEYLNKAIVDAASIIIAVYDYAPISRRASSLRTTLEYALAKNKTIRQIKPRTL